MDHYSDSCGGRGGDGPRTAHFSSQKVDLSTDRHDEIFRSPITIVHHHLRHHHLVGFIHIMIQSILHLVL